MSLVCSWNELGMSHVQVSSSPFCTRPFWRIPNNVRAIRANRLKPAIRNFLPPPPRSTIRKKRGSVREPRNDSRESGDSRESANRFARIGPSKVLYWINSSLRFELVFSSSGGRLGAYAYKQQASTCDGGL